jgi:hypothetical protein
MTDQQSIQNMRTNKDVCILNWEVQRLGIIWTASKFGIPVENVCNPIHSLEIWSEICHLSSSLQNVMVQLNIIFQAGSKYMVGFNIMEINMLLFIL